ncbi:JPH3 [Cordylochernes scorpioides]|uniref:JPH3 n=1 Tax=Cordylochernes scorpioides TaxID=51811 RepID=A0ABY6LPQ9_9ARAC|nr:JPH3 [Cordylochernes scorpioides]
MRQGYGVRSSAPYGLASHSRHRPGGSTGHVPALLDDDTAGSGRGGFVLKGRGERRTTTGNEKKGLLQRLKRQRSAGEIVSMSVTSSGAVSSASSDSVAATEVSWVSQDEVMDSKVIETYMGEWKGDKRSGFGIAERSDGLRYEGEWHNNKKYGYGVTYFKDGTREQGKYKNNVLITSGRRKHLFLLRSAKFRERISAATSAAVRSSQIALEKADIAISRTATARGKAESADIAVLHAREDAEIARMMARQYAPDFHQPGES